MSALFFLTCLAALQTSAEILLLSHLEQRVLKCIQQRENIEHDILNQKITAKYADSIA